MVSCGGQATIPMVAAVSRVQPVEYAEIVATGIEVRRPRDRQNIDEFTRTTAEVVERVGESPGGKAIITINPAEPPPGRCAMTIHRLTDGELIEDGIVRSVHAMIREVQLRPVFAEERPCLRRPAPASTSRSRARRFAEVRW